MSGRVADCKSSRVGGIKSVVSTVGVCKCGGKCVAVTSRNRRKVLKKKTGGGGAGSERRKGEEGAWGV